MNNNEISIYNFNNNYKNFINNNPYWNDVITPLYPIEKNIFKISSIKYDESKLIKDLNIVKNNYKWINKGKFSSDWSSITLKSKDGKDQSFLQETTLLQGNKNIYKYTDVMNKCEYIKKILQKIPTDIYLVRILKLKRGGKIKYHTDELVFSNKENIIRCHLPIVTNEHVKFKIGYPYSSPAPGYNIWGAFDLYEKYIAPGYLWYTNVNTLHSVENNGETDRYHLVIDMKPTRETINYIYN